MNDQVNNHMLLNHNVVYHEDSTPPKKIKMGCKSCAFYIKKQEDIGECRKNPPDIDGNFSLVYGNKWCGSYEPINKKILLG